MIPPLIFDERDRFAAPRIYCVTPFSKNESEFTAAVYAIIGFELTLTIMHFMLFLYNRLEIGKQKK